MGRRGRRRLLRDVGGPVLDPRAALAAPKVELVGPIRARNISEIHLIESIRVEIPNGGLLRKIKRIPIFGESQLGNAKAIEEPLLRKRDKIGVAL